MITQTHRDIAHDLTSGGLLNSRIDALIATGHDANDLIREEIAFAFPNADDETLDWAFTVVAALYAG